MIVPTLTRLVVNSLMKASLAGLFLSTLNGAVRLSTKRVTTGSLAVS